VSREGVKEQIRAAFAGVERPGNWALRGSNEGEEPYLVDRDFADKADWRTLDAAFLDWAPDGYGSALSFLSDEAFRYFLPAYLLADLDGALQTVDPAFHMTHGLDDATRDQPLNPRRYGARTWLDAMRHKFAVFTKQEAAAILAYLRLRLGDPCDEDRIASAIRNYWSPRAE
jgi:hypothetical protein